MGPKSAVFDAFPLAARVALASQLYAQGQAATRSNFCSDHHDQPFKACHRDECLVTHSEPIQARTTHDYP